MATVTAMTADATTAALAGKVDKGTLVYNVRDYGAVGDGVTGDDAALASAISAATANNGGVVFLPTGDYLLTSTSALTLSTIGTTLRGAGPETSRILIGGTFTGTTALMVTGDDCCIEDLTIAGANSSSTAGNPVVDAIYVYGAKHVKILNCTFQYINSWCIEAVSDSSGNNPDGLMVSKIFAQQSSAGIHLKGNSPNSYIYHGQVSDVWFKNMGVSTGAGANLDVMFIEDAQDLEFSNINLQVLNGTGSNLHIKGAAKDVFMVNVRCSGYAGSNANCLIEDSAGGSPSNIHITNGLFQYGVIGLRITGAATYLFFRSMRILDCRSHGASIEGSGSTINLLDLGFSTNGAGSSGSNYDINWSGTATGVVNNCRFATNIVATGSAGVQASINIAASGQKVRCINTRFEGSGASSSNWVTNTPNILMDVTNAVSFLGSGFRIKEGSNARMGTATLVAGTVTVSNTSTTANTRIFVGCATPGGTPGALFVNAHTVGTSFQIKSTSSTDTSVVSYLLVDAA